MADQRPPAGEWAGIPNPDDPGWSGWVQHWLAAHSPAPLVQEATALRLSPRKQGRRLWRHLTDRIAALEFEVAQQSVDGITDRALEARDRNRLEELADARTALRVLELIGPHLPER